MRDRPGALALILLSMFAGACSSSRNGEDLGTIRGVVEQVLHHGAVPEEGEPGTTVSAVVGCRVRIRALDSGEEQTVTTDSSGRFELRLPAGRYSIAAEPEEEEMVPMSVPAGQTLEVRADSTQTVTLQFDVYAP